MRYCIAAITPVKIANSVQCISCPFDACAAKCSHYRMLISGISELNHTCLSCAFHAEVSGY